MVKVLIIDDEAQIRNLLARIISLEGYSVSQADNLRSAHKQLLLQNPDIVLCDVFLSDGNGVDFVVQIKNILPECVIIMLTAHGNIADGVQAIKNGAFDYLTKGDDNDRIIPLLANAAEKIALQSKIANLEKMIRKEYSFDSIIGKSKPLLMAVELARKVAATDTSILLTGETGTGKEVFAQAIHGAGKRSCGPMVAVNCSAFSRELLDSEMFGYKAGAFTGALRDKKGVFEQADKGTIFLDEIGEMPLELQSKLLRTLESGEFMKVGDCMATKVDVRIIAATNRDLKESIAKGMFREDLYYRLSVFTIELPPLCSRSGDIVLLAQSFIDAFALKMGKPIEKTEQPFFDALLKYKWNGNIRELRNTIERSMIMASGNVLRVCDLPLEIQMAQGSTPNLMELAAVEKAHICKVLHYTGGNKTETARLLKIGLTTLYRKIEEYEITGTL
ncbi:MAG: sigma-54 dependent transcriptional regulator [Bacteroidales bacterium]